MQSVYYADDFVSGAEGGGVLLSNQPPRSQLQPSRYTAFSRSSGSLIPFRISRNRLKSIGLRIQPSIPRSLSSCRCLSYKEADTAKMGIRPLRCLERRSLVASDVSPSSMRMALVASKPFKMGILPSRAIRNCVSENRSFTYWISIKMQSKSWSSSTVSKPSWPLVVLTTIWPSRVSRFAKIVRLMSLSCW